MVSLEGGCWKSAQSSNSLAAYPTARRVLRGRGGSNVALLPDRSRKKCASADESSQSIASCGNGWPKCLLRKSLKEGAQCSVVQMNVDAW